MDNESYHLEYFSLQLVYYIQIHVYIATRYINTLKVLSLFTFLHF